MQLQQIGQRSQRGAQQSYRATATRTTTVEAVKRGQSIGRWHWRCVQQVAPWPCTLMSTHNARMESLPLTPRGRWEGVSKEIEVDSLQFQRPMTHKKVNDIVVVVAVAACVSLGRQLDTNFACGFVSRLPPPVSYLNLVNLGALTKLSSSITIEWK